MSLSPSYMLGFIVGLVLAIGLFAVLIIVLKKKMGGTGEFDERQQLARGKAFRSAFFTLLALATASTAYTVSVKDPLFDQAAGMCIAICISVTVFAIQCILSDAYLSVSEKPRFVLIFFSILAVFNGAIGAIHIAEGDIIQNGALGVNSMNLILAVMFLFIMPALIYKMIKNKRSEEE